MSLSLLFSLSLSLSLSLSPLLSLLSFSLSLSLSLSLSTFHNVRVSKHELVLITADLRERKRSACVVRHSIDAAIPRESSLLSRLARFKEVLLANHLDCKMNPLFARSIHAKMSTNILDHIRTLAVLLEAKFSDGGSRRAVTAPTRATGGVFFFLPRSATVAENPKKVTKLPGCFSTWSEIQNSKTPSESVKSEQVSFSSKVERNCMTCFFTRFERCGISKKIPSLTLTQLDAELII